MKKCRIIGEGKWIYDMQHGDYTMIRKVYYKIQQRKCLLFWVDVDVKTDSAFEEYYTRVAEVAEKTLFKLECDGYEI